LRKDLSNFDQAIELFRDPDLRRELTDNAYTDLIASGAWSYERFIEGFDRVLEEAGVEPPPGGRADPAGLSAVRVGHGQRTLQRLRSTLSYHPLLSRALWRITRRPIEAVRRARRSRARA
jgi:hypothetical protein